MSRLAMIIVASAVPSEIMSHYTLIQRRLVPHCDRVFSFAQQRMQETLIDEINIQWRSNAYHQLGALYSDQGKIEEAEEMYLRALAGKEKAWGAEHTSTRDTVNNLGNVYKNQGKMKEAEEMYLRALARYEKAWGAEHKQPLDTRYSLAITYKKWSMFEDAAKHFELVVQGYAKLIGAEHSEIVEALHQMEGLSEQFSEKKEML